MRRYLRIMVITCASLAVSLTLRTGSVGASDALLTAEQLSLVQRVNYYLNSLTHLRGSFTQLDANGGLSEGEFYMERPGRMRFEYAPPNPLLIVSDGRWVGIEDRNERSTDKYLLSTTPLSLLLGENVRLNEEARILAASEQDGMISITVESRSNLAPGRLTLFFSAADMTLNRWIVQDAQGLRTEVAVFDLVAGKPANGRLFWINDNNVFDVNQGRQ